MPLITWNESLSVGYEPIDSQHKMWINYINQLHDAMGQGKGRQILGDVLDGLVWYTQTHFAFEEQVMQQHAYPGYAHQHAEHQAFAVRMLELRSAFMTGENVVTMDVMHSLRNWLADHIQASDKALGAHLSAKT
jgi:hemerythrin-like metal-binding protein